MTNFMTMKYLFEEVDKTIKKLKELPPDYDNFIVIEGTFGDMNDSLCTSRENRQNVQFALGRFKHNMIDYIEAKETHINMSIVVIKDMDIYCEFNTDGYEKTLEGN